MNLYKKRIILLFTNIIIMLLLDRRVLNTAIVKQTKQRFSVKLGVVWIIYRSTNCKAHIKIYQKFKNLLEKIKNTRKPRDLNEESDTSVIIQRIARVGPTISSLNFADEDFDNNDYTQLDREPLLGLLDDRSVEYSTVKQ